MFLKGYAVGWKQIDCTVLTPLMVCAAAKTYVDLTRILPASMPENDIEELYTIQLQKNATVCQFCLSGERW